MQIPSIHKRLASIEPRHVLVITQKLNEYIEWEAGRKVTRNKLRNREDAFVLKLTSAGIRTTVITAKEFSLSKVQEEGGPHRIDAIVIAGEVTYQSFYLAKIARETLPNIPVFIEFCEEGFNQSALEAIKHNSTQQGIEDLLYNLVYLTASPKQPRSLDL
jgi:hypothetical protein